MVVVLGAGPLEAAEPDLWPGPLRGVAAEAARPTLLGAAPVVLCSQRGVRAPARRSSARALNRASSADTRNHGEGEKGKDVRFY